MSHCHKQIFNIVFFDGLHTLDTLATAILSLKIVNRHSLDITEIGSGNNGISSWNQVFYIDIIFIVADFTSSVVTEFISNQSDFFLDYAQQKFFICKDCF